MYSYYNRKIIRSIAVCGIDKPAWRAYYFSIPTHGGYQYGKTFQRGNFKQNELYFRPFWGNKENAGKR